MAKCLGIQPRTYARVKRLANQVLSDRRGQVVLVCSEQSMVEPLVNALGGYGADCSAIRAYDTLSVVTIYGSVKTNVLTVK